MHRTPGGAPGDRRADAYNPCMLNSLDSAFRSAVMERATLVVNHVIASETVALQRLKPHAGRCIRLQVSEWPGLLPMPAPATFCVTPAGLLEWWPEGCEDPALQVTVDAANPALGLLGGLTGRKPKIDIAGDAAFATDLNWLIDNLRWDVEDDLARVVGVVPARRIASFGRGLGVALRGAVQTVDAMVRRGPVGVDDPQPR